MSRFRDVTHDVLTLLKVVPGEVGKPRKGRAPTQPELAATYGKWPPADLDIHPLPKAHFLDVANPVKAGGILNFKASSVAVDAESVVLELAGGGGPGCSASCGPMRSRARRARRLPDSSSTSGRRADRTERTSSWVAGSKDRIRTTSTTPSAACSKASTIQEHRSSCARAGSSPQGRPVSGREVRCEGRHGVSVADSDDSISYGALSNFDEMGRLLADLQAYMFWRAGIAAPPTHRRHTALSAYSSANYTLASWLNRTDEHLSQEQHQSHLLPRSSEVDDCVDAGLLWRRHGQGQARPVVLGQGERSTSGRTDVLGLKAMDPLASPPYLLNAADKKVTMALFSMDSWDRTFKDVLGIVTKWTYWDAHHFVPATVLTHALAQGDLS